MTGTLALVIPAFDPDHHLIAVVREVVALDTDRLFRAIVVVDDGSSAASAPVFGRAGAVDRVSVLRRETNGGQGRAIKTGFAHVLTSIPELAGVVTADADGQHAPADIIRVGHTLVASPEAYVLGVRRFGPEVPLRNRLGNRITCRVLAWATGTAVEDTQSGLRGYSRRWCEHSLAVAGERYEFSSAVLMAAIAAGERIDQVPIATIYDPIGQPSHFRPLRDSLRVLATIYRYM